MWYYFAVVQYVLASMESARFLYYFLHFHMSDLLNLQVLYSYQGLGYVTLLWNPKLVKVMHYFCLCFSTTVFFSLFQLVFFFPRSSIY